MKQKINIEDVVEVLKSQSILMTKNQIIQLYDYHKSLMEWKDKSNLFSAGDENFLIERHLFTSFLYVYHIAKIFNRKQIKILDVGSGAGFPGILLAIYFFQNDILLLDSSRKKYLFLLYVKKKLDLKCRIMCERSEIFAKTTPERFDVIVARSVASLPKLISMIRPLMKNDGLLFTLKGSNFQEELKLIDKSYKLSELKIEESWLEKSKYLNSKVMIKLELINAGKQLV